MKTFFRRLLALDLSSWFISLVDLTKSLFQISLAEKSRRLTGFTSHIGFHRGKTLPFGSCATPKIMQRLIDWILRGAHKYTSAHLDDIASFSMTFPEHVKHVPEVLTRQRMPALQWSARSACLQPNKHIKCLGHVLKDGVIKPDDDKVSAIINIAPAKTKKGLCVILGSPVIIDPIFQCMQP